MDKSALNDIAKQLVAPGKGILAADESFPTIKKRFKKVGIAKIAGAKPNKTAEYSVNKTGEITGLCIVGFGIAETLTQLSEGLDPLQGKPSESLTKLNLQFNQLSDLQSFKNLGSLKI